MGIEREVVFVAVRRGVRVSFGWWRGGNWYAKIDTHVMWCDSFAGWCFNI